MYFQKNQNESLKVITNSTIGQKYQFSYQMAVFPLQLLCLFLKDID